MSQMPSEPTDDLYGHRKALLLGLQNFAGGPVLLDLLRAAFDRYRLSAWSGNETHGFKDARAILERVLLHQTMEDEDREVITLTLAALDGADYPRRLEELQLIRNGLMGMHVAQFGEWIP